MNVIIANRYSSVLQSLDIEVIKKIEGEYTIDEIISQFNKGFYFNRMILDITAIKDYKDIKKLQRLSIELDMSKVILLLDDSPDSSSTDYLSKLISMGIYNFTQKVEGIIYLYNHPNSYRDVAQFHQLDSQREVVVERFSGGGAGTRVLGVKNVNNSAGASTLIYMIKKQLSKNYTVAAIEVDKRDFVYFDDKDMLSTVSQNLGNTIATCNTHEVILIDINNSAVAEAMCHQVIYLIEPSVIKLKKLLYLNRKILSEIKNKCIILNQSVLSAKDVDDFEYEANLKVFYNLPPLDDRANDLPALNQFLMKLGFDRQTVLDDQKSNKLFNLFN